MEFKDPPYVLVVWWNTDADGKRVDDEDEKPQCWYGDFDTLEEAQSWAEAFCGDDTDVFEDEIVSRSSLPEGYVNDKEEWKELLEL